MSNATRIPALLLLLASAGCWHTVVDTGLPPGPVGYEEGWATSWVFALVPTRIDATGVCDGPWAQVETQQSFGNGLVSLLTLGIYTPHEVRVVCAAGPGEEASRQGRARSGVK